MEYIDFIEEVNDIIYHNDIDRAINFICLNINNKENKELVYILIDAFQLYGYINKENKDEFLKKFSYTSFEIKLNSYRGKYLDLFNQGQLSLIKAMSKNYKTII